MTEIEYEAVSSLSPMAKVNKVFSNSGIFVINIYSYLTAPMTLKWAFSFS